MPATLHIYVPLHVYCSDRDPTWLHISVQQNTMHLSPAESANYANSVLTRAAHPSKVETVNKKVSRL